MTSTFNAPMFNAIVVREQPFAMIWDRQVWDLDFWAVPAITENRDAALAFVRFATSTEALARQTRWISYGPVRRSEEHTSELQSLMRISYAVFCLKKKKNT